MNRGLRGFYGVIDVPAPGALAMAERLVAGGASALQVRLKGRPAGVLFETARSLRGLTSSAGVLLVVNDRLDVALAAGADAVHLGQGDLGLAAARAALAACGRALQVGISTHSPAQAEAAARAGADYLGFGPVYATATKEDPDPVQGIEALAQAVQRAAPVPVVAIGGITPERAREVAGAGAAAACAIASVNGAADPVAAARAIAGAFG